MGEFNILKGKKILAVDDEPDILETIGELLFDSEVIGVMDFEEAHKLIQHNQYDLVILDIMGVRGFDLLELCTQRGMPAAMLTARALDISSVNRAVRLGAVSFLPKNEMHILRELTAEILEGLEKGQSHWDKLFKRLGPFFKEKCNILWEDLEKRTRARTPWS